MENSKPRNRLVIIFHPLGEKKYSTKDLGSEEYKLVQQIQCVPNMVTVIVKKDRKLIKEIYSGMPYYSEGF